MKERGPYDGTKKLSLTDVALLGVWDAVLLRFGLTYKLLWIYYWKGIILG